MLFLMFHTQGLESLDFFCTFGLVYFVLFGDFLLCFISFLFVGFLLLFSCVFGFLLSYVIVSFIFVCFVDCLLLFSLFLCFC